MWLCAFAPLVGFVLLLVIFMRPLPPREQRPEQTEAERAAAQRFWCYCQGDEDK